MANEIIQAEQNEISNVSKKLENDVKAYFDKRKLMMLYKRAENSFKLNSIRL